MPQLPKPTITRLCQLHRLLDDLQAQSVTHISSSRIAERLGEAPHNIRKDIGYLGEIVSSGGGYDVDELKRVLAGQLGLNLEHRVCVVGLGELGASLLNFNKHIQSGYQMVAGFDSNINRVETMRSDVDVFPTYAMAETIQRFQIELAILAVPASAAQEVADKLVRAGIRGIINFAPVIVRTEHPDVFVRNIDVLGELNVLSALITLNS